MRTALAIALWLALACAQPLAAADTIAFGNRVISVGDSLAKVLEAAGQPTRRVRLENAQGAAVGERWDYVQRDKVVMLTIQRGRVTAVDEAR